jgi:hypothetical protein
VFFPGGVFLLSGAFFLSGAFVHVVQGTALCSSCTAGAPADLPVMASTLEGIFAISNITANDALTV